MKDLIDFVQEPGATTFFSDVAYRLDMIDAELFHFSNSESGEYLVIPDKSLRTATYYGDGRFKLRVKVRGQTVAIHIVVVYNGEEKYKIPAAA
jgi:hypothetical protein